MASTILTCDTCGEMHSKYIVLKKLNDFKTKPKHFCSQKCVVDFLILNNWVQFNLDCSNNDIVSAIIKEMNMINKLKNQVKTTK